MNALRALVRRGRDAVRAARYAGAGRVCPVCGGSSRAFAPFGAERRAEGQCVRCGALERHRLVWRWLERERMLEAPAARWLHVAPEPALAPRLRARLGARHVTTDLEPGRVDVRADVIRLPHRDATFDVVFCSHVLEHVVDDAAALREFRRVLAPGGRAVLMVPITAERTDEDPSVTDPRARLARFGQADHVRRYGPDFAERVRDAGFEVARIGVEAVATPEEARRFGLTAATGDVWLGVRPPSAPRG